MWPLLIMVIGKYHRPSRHVISIACFRFSTVAWHVDKQLHNTILLFYFFHVILCCTFLYCTVILSFQKKGGHKPPFLARKVSNWSFLGGNVQWNICHITHHGYQPSNQRSDPRSTKNKRRFILLPWTEMAGGSSSKPPTHLQREVQGGLWKSERRQRQPQQSDTSVSTPTWKQARKARRCDSYLQIWN